MSNLTCNTMRAACSPEWNAKTYSEYLLTCAKAKLDLIDSINDAIADDSLETLIDSKADEYQALCDRINANVLDIMTENHVDVNSISPQDSGYDAILMDALFDYDEEHDYFTLDSDGIALIQFSSAFETRSTYSLQQVKDFIDVYRNTSKDDILAKNAAVISAIDAKTTQVLNANKLQPNSTLTLADGYVPANEVIRNLITSGNFGDKLSEFELTAMNSGNVSIPNLKMNFKSLFEDLKGSVASTICWAQAFEACTIAGIADRMTWFENSVKNYFTEFSDKINASVNSVRSILTNLKNGATELCDIAEDMLGWDKLTNEDAVTSETDVYAYTGASPLADIDLHTAKGVATIAAGAVVAVGKAVFSAVKAGVKKLWSKIRPFAKAITADPEDIYTVNKHAESYTVDGMVIQGKDKLLTFYGNDSSDTTTAANWCEEHVGKWIAWKTYFSEILLRIKSVTVTPLLKILAVTVDWQLKPRCINPEKAADFGLISYTGGWGSVYGVVPPETGLTPEKLNSWYNAGNVYIDDDADERIKYMGFVAGLVATSGLAFSANHEMAASVGYRLPIKGFMANYEGDLSNVLSVDYNNFALNYQSGIRVYPYVWYNNNQYIRPTSVTNNDFMRLLTGYCPANESSNPDIDDRFGWQKQFLRYNSGAEGESTQNINFDNKPTRYEYAVVAPLLNLFFNQMVDKADNPTDYLFLPYSMSNYTWEEPRFKIKNDAQNAAIADILLSAIVAVVVIVLAVVVCKSIIKIFKLNKYRKLQNKIHSIDQSMWNDGHELTLSEAWSYKRKMRKLDKLSTAAAGLASSTGAASTIVDAVKNNSEDIINTIKGTLSPTTSTNPQSWSNDASLNLSSDMITGDSDYQQRIYYAVKGRTFTVSEEHSRHPSDMPGIEVVDENDNVIGWYDWDDGHFIPKE